MRYMGGFELPPGATPQQVGLVIDALPVDQRTLLIDGADESQDGSQRKLIRYAVGAALGFGLGFVLSRALKKR